MAADPAARRKRSAGALDPSEILRWVERTTADQGLSVAITDPGCLARLATLFGPPPGRSPKQQRQ